MLGWDVADAVDVVPDGSGGNAAGFGQGREYSGSLLARMNFNVLTQVQCSDSLGHKLDLQALAYVMYVPRSRTFCTFIDLLAMCKQLYSAYERGE
jgi:hypothetical protein